MSYTPQTNELKDLVREYGLTLEYDPMLLTATVFGSEITKPLILSDMPVQIFEMESQLVQDIRDYMTLHTTKQASASRDIKSFKQLYAASVQKFSSLTPFKFGKLGRIRLYGHEELAIISTIPGPKRVGFELSGDLIKGTLQLANKKFNMSSSVYLYSVIPNVDYSRIRVVDDFVFDVQADELKPNKIWSTTYSQLTRHFKVESLFTEATNE